MRRIQYPRGYQKLRISPILRANFTHHRTGDRINVRDGASEADEVVADTVVARSYKGGNECQRLDGVKLQAQAHDQPSQIVMHVRMLDVEAWLQPEALGIVGVNLLYGAFFHHHEPEKLIDANADSWPPSTGRAASTGTASKPPSSSWA